MQKPPEVRRLAWVGRSAVLDHDRGDDENLRDQGDQARSDALYDTHFTSLICLGAISLPQRIWCKARIFSTAKVE